MEGRLSGFGGPGILQGLTPLCAVVRNLSRVLDGFSYDDDLTDCRQGEIGYTNELANCLMAVFPLSPVSTPTRSRPNLLAI